MPPQGSARCIISRWKRSQHERASASRMCLIKADSLRSTTFLAGHVPVGFIGLTPPLPLLKSGQLKPLATLGQQRSSHLSAVPTVAETLPGYDIEGSWLGLFAPAGTPGDIMRRLNVEANKLIEEKEFSDFLISRGIIPMEMSAPQFAQLMRDDTVRFREIIGEFGIHIE
jgi:tripartite-type tricarboxylate transporter receptor subunit TctC